MGKKCLYAMMIAAFALPVSAQRMVDASDGAFSTAMAAPTVERTVTPTENGYSVKYNNLSDMGLKKARAASKNQVVREGGKIWRYHADYNGNMDPCDDIYLDVCLSGTTEIDGKEYLNCYVWKTEDEFSEESAALIAYMREEDGKVYVRYVPYADAVAMDKGISITPYAPMMNIVFHSWEDVCNSDILLFDSNLKEGDVLRSSDDDTICKEFTVKKIDQVECLGKTYKRALLWGWDHYSFYEGIGDIMGLLPLPGALSILYCEDPWYLVEVLDNNGNVIFDSSKIVSGVEGITDEANVVSEKYYDFSGIEIVEPTQSGVYIRTRHLDNGKIRTEKFIKR